MIFIAIQKNKRALRATAAFVALNLMVELIMPMKAFALTGGPSQPEVQSFEPVSANQMVDPFTGDFTYNIPLLDVGGYPINISYHAGPSLDEEASWVGLGWNINPGVINRNMRGLPDDFNSPNLDPGHDDNDYILRKNKMKPSNTYGVSLSPKGEIFGVSIAKDVFTVGVKYNNYKGVSSFMNLSPSKSCLSLNFDSQTGLGVNANFSKVFNGKMNDVKNGNEEVDCEMVSTTSTTTNHLTAGMGIKFNSREGLKEVTLSANYYTKKVTEQKRTCIEGPDGSTIAPPLQEINSKINGSIPIDFLNSTYIPYTTDNQYNFNLGLSIELGAEFFGLNPDSKIGLTYSKSGKLKKPQGEKYPAYGFLYHSHVHNNYSHPDVDKKHRGRATMDYNVYGSSSLNRSNSENELPYTVSTFDVFSVSGQGISGVYRPHSSAVGSVYDPVAESVYVPPIGVGIDIAAGNTAKTGVDVQLTYYKSKSGRWEKENNLFQYLDYSASGNIGYEPVYFKNAGEKTSVDKAFLEKIDYGVPARPEMDKAILSTTGSIINGVGLKAKYKSNGGDHDIVAPLTRTIRDKRNQVITTLTAQEASEYGLIKYRSDHAKNHHIGQITAINPDGSRYVYAQPAYNIIKQEHSFSVTGRTVSPEGLSEFLPADASTNNSLGVESFYDFEQTPPYAHSYLLNAVLSPDYVDITRNGPTPDDNGSYTNITYNKLNNDYKWRAPYAPNGDANRANFQKGLYSDAEDDKASYVYGEKEIFYVNKIETKTHVAIFHTSNRNDALGVVDDLGGKNTTVRLKELDSIQLFTAYEYYNNPLNPKPLKVVHFRYDYSLCPGIPNSSNGGGKLTLKRIFFTYGTSSAGSQSPYVFAYSNNFSYGYKSYDRWGNYNAPITNPTNDEFPYTTQNKALADQYAAAWSLSEITLPSGGKINIEYEADDYSLVQDRYAMEMFKVAGWGHTSGFPSSASDALYDYDRVITNSGNPQNLYVYFELKPGDNDAIKVKKYLPQKINGKRYLYLNSFVKFKDGVEEFVPCYAEIDESNPIGLCGNGTHGFIKLKGLPAGEAFGVHSSFAEVNPVTIAALQYFRLNLPHKVYPGQDVLRGSDGVSISDLKKAAFQILGIFPEVLSLYTGFNTNQIINGRARSVNKDKSWIRLQSPNFTKLGGGHRVKKVLINNNWASIVSGEESQTMGQVYDYKCVDSFVGSVVSSGVASYEPQLGGDENPMHTPSFMSSKNFLSIGAENQFYNDKPLGESVFPSPSVGYREVTIRNIKPEDIDPNTNERITRHGMGYTIQKFYTAADFPVFANRTEIDATFKKSRLLGLFGFSYEIVGATQGFSIEINDMHGRPKSMETYDEIGKFITKTEYKYKTATNNPKLLDNKVTVMKKDGTIDREAIVGYEVEMVVHPRQMQEGAITVDVNTDGDMFMVGPVPAITLGFGLSLSGSYSSLRTASTTKLVNRYALLESVTVTDQSSSVTTTNIAFDEETGEVLLTETTNEFSDKIYNFTYPAHWAYDGMGPAYKNIGYLHINAVISNGVSNFPSSYAEFFVPGDELIAKSSSPEKLLWVLDKKFNGSSYDVTFIDEFGATPPNGTYELKNIRSGRRNMQAIPVGKIVANKNPIPTTGNYFINTTTGAVDVDRVNNASAASFSDHWQAYRHDPGCWVRSCPPDPLSIDRIFPPPSNSNQLCLHPLYTLSGVNKFPFVNAVVNPYVLGIKGNWRPDYTYVYYDRNNTSFMREQADAGTSQFNGTDISEAGKINSFVPFWFYLSGKWQNRGVDYTGGGNNPWIWNAKANQINPDGVELENKNSLDIYSSAIYSYISKQPLAVSYNARLRETLFEGFEDYPEINYNVLNCNTGALPTTVLTSTFTSSIEASKLPSVPTHWYFWPTLVASQAMISNAEAHTGKNSLKIIETIILRVPTQLYDKTTNPHNTGSPLSEYKVNPVDLTDVFSPSPNGTDNKPQKYILSYWIKTTGSTTGAITVELNNSPVTTTLLSEGPLIEGWKKLDLLIDLGSTGNVGDIFEIVIQNPTPTVVTYFDDIRIHPLEANMKSFVYDNNKLRLSATLDENNYATFFEYDEEGNLVRTKRETERGIITINENRQNIKH